mgnify:CR=1 FL=1
MPRWGRVVHLGTIIPGKAYSRLGALIFGGGDFGGGGFGGACGVFLVGLDSDLPGLYRKLFSIAKLRARFHFGHESRQCPMKTINVVAAVIVHDGKVFATQRGYGEFVGGWEFPGGKVEAGETPEQALVREIREELETTVSVDSFVYQVEYDYPAFHLSMGCYMCSIVEGHLHLLEHSAAKWLGAANLRSVDWLPADIEVVNALEAKGVLS